MNNRDVLMHDLFEIMQALKRGKITDFRFQYVYTLKELNGPFFFIELVVTYYSDARNTVRSLGEAMDRPVLNFKELDELCVKLKGGTSCIGACALAAACSEFRLAVDAKSRQLCLEQFNKLKQEFYMLQDNVEAIIELESRIISHKSADN